MNLTALQAQCKSRFRDTSNAIYADADWTNYLNDAYRDVNAAQPYWPYMETRTPLTVPAHTAGIALSTGVFHVTAVYDETDKYLLEPLQGRSEYRDEYPDPAAITGPPVHYRLRGGYLEVYPRPTVDTVLQVDHFVAPAALSAGGDVPAFPEQFHPILVSGAMAYAYEDDGNAAQAAIHWARFNTRLQMMALTMLAPRTSRFEGIADAW